MQTQTNSTSEISLATIELAAKRFAADREELSTCVQQLNNSIEALKRHTLPMLKRRLNTAAESEAALTALVDQSRQLFIQPRTVIFHGIKVGIQKGRGGITWDDESKVLDLIARHFTAAEADLLIKTTRKPIKAALEDLDIATLKKIGCRIEDTGDQILIKPADSQVDKLVNSLLKDAIEDAANTANPNT